MRVWKPADIYTNLQKSHIQITVETDVRVVLLCGQSMYCIILLKVFEGKKNLRKEFTEKYFCDAYLIVVVGYLFTPELVRFESNRTN